MFVLKIRMNEPVKLPTSIILQPTERMDIRVHSCKQIKYLCVTEISKPKIRKKKKKKKIHAVD
ncbi:hypothetical protein HanIR_Chr05g0236241 [Helianthus annuus]|nr:hypothetical protein HanIR_Chr05g0236241 [Helianthus annuus]